MVGAKSAVDFNTIIQSDRARRKNEQLAQQIFGKGRRASAPGSGFGAQKQGKPLSLADRIGSSKRSTSVTLQPTSFKAAAAGKQATRRTRLPIGNINADWTHDLHESDRATSFRENQQQRRGLKAAQAVRDVLLSGNSPALSPALNSQVNIVKSSKSSNGMAIRGLAGPYIIVAENFAPGTTAADIESAMAPIGGPIMKCIMISSQPVAAEITFESKEGADNVIAQFDKQIADGLVLSLYHKSNAAGPELIIAQSEPAPRTAPRGPRADLASERPINNRGSVKYDRYEPRNRSLERREHGDRTNVTDGSYGFEEQMDLDDGDDKTRDSGRGRGLYSDNIVGRRDGRDRYIGRGGRQLNSRDKGRGYR